MPTLKAVGLLDVDAGEIVRPGILRIEEDRIVGVGGAAEGEVIDLGDSILLPGLMDMEVNLLMGGRGETPALSQVQDDPPTRVLRAARCGPASPPCATWVCSSRPAVTCWMWRWARQLTRAGSRVRGSCPPGTPSLRRAGTWIRRCSRRSHPTFSSCPSRRASPTASTRSERPCDTRSSTARS